jgi:hypothetical protein
MEVARNPYYVFDLDAPASLLAFLWTDKKAEMTDDDYMAALLQYAKMAVLHRTRRCLVDVRSFKHQVGDELGLWRRREIVPLYHAAGVEKFAFVVQATRTSLQRASSPATSSRQGAFPRWPPPAWLTAPADPSR